MAILPKLLALLVAGAVLSGCEKVTSVRYDYPPGQHPGYDTAPLYHPRGCRTFFGIVLTGCPYDVNRRGYTPKGGTK
jgi:hypothetical protein